MRFLGIDYGRRRIGLALGEKGQVRPLGVIAYNCRCFEEIARLCQREKIGKIVLGWSDDLRRDLENFQKQLEKIRPVVRIDETLTTQKGIARMIKIGLGKKKRQKERDAFAAMEILTCFFQGGENV